MAFSAPNLRRLIVMIAVIAAASPAFAAVEPGGDTPSPQKYTVELHSDGTLSLHLDEAVPLVDIVREIGIAIGAEVAVWRDPGPIGPIDIESLQPSDMLLELAGSKSLALRYRDGRIAEIILIGRRDGTLAIERHVIQPPTAEPPPQPAVLTEESAESREAASVRDIVKLSYRQDRAAMAELQHLFETSDDPAIRASAIGAIAGSGHRNTVRLIYRALLDPASQVRLRAAQSLWVARGSDAAARLARLAESDPAPEVRNGVAQLLDNSRQARSQTRDGPRPQAVDR